MSLSMLLANLQNGRSLDYLQHMQTESDHPTLGAEKTGLRISKQKIKVMRANSKQREKIKLKNEELEDFQSFILRI